MTSRIAIAAAALAADLGSAAPALAQGTGSVAAALHAEIDGPRSRLSELGEQQKGAGSVAAGRGVMLAVAGRVNQAFLHAKQADQDQAFVVDKDALGSRFELLTETALGDLTIGVEIVVSAEVNSPDEVDFSFNQGSADEDGALGDFR